MGASPFYEWWDVTDSFFFFLRGGWGAGWGTKVIRKSFGGTKMFSIFRKNPIAPDPF